MEIIRNVLFLLFRVRYLLTFIAIRSEINYDDICYTIKLIKLFDEIY